MGGGKSEIESRQIELLRLKRAIDECKSWQEVDMRFTEGSPLFEIGVRNAYPGITNAEMRMAKLISVGFETPDLARLLYLTPESVKKGRSRLRQRLGLSPTANIAHHLLGYHHG